MHFLTIKSTQEILTFIILFPASRVVYFGKNLLEILQHYTCISEVTIYYHII